MQITLEPFEFLEILNNQRKISEQLQALQNSVDRLSNQLSTQEKEIMSTLAQQLTSIDQQIDAAVQALTAEEGSVATSVQNAVTFIEGLVSAGGITAAQAAPILADLQTQTTNIQNVTALLTSAQGTLASATGPSSAPPAAPAAPAAPPTSRT